MLAERVGRVAGTEALDVDALLAAFAVVPLESLRMRARAAAILNHPNICPVYDVGEIDGRPYLAMAFIEGRPLSALIDPGSPMDPRKAARLMEAEHWDHASLEDLSVVMVDSSICGLGQAAPNPVRCVQKYFPHEVA